MSTVRARLRVCHSWTETPPFVTIILVGGMVLTGITVALFELIDADDFQEWYLTNVVV